MSGIIQIQNRIFEFIVKRKIKELTANENQINIYNAYYCPNKIKESFKSDSKYFEQLRLSRSICTASKEQINELKTFEFYQGYYYSIINSYLFANIEEKDRNVQLYEFISKLSKNISKFKLKSNVIGIKRSSLKHVSHLSREGDELNFKGFLSTSIYVNHRLNCEGKETNIKNEALLILKIPKGTEAVYLEESVPRNKQRKEYELLIQKGMKYKVECYKKVFSNRIIVLKQLQESENV